MSPFQFLLFRTIHFIEKILVLCPIYIYIYKIIKNLDPNKAHGHDMIRIRMIKLCSILICKPLEIIFQNCLRLGKFLSGSKVDSAFHPSEVDKMSTRNFWELSGEK